MLWLFRLLDRVRDIIKSKGKSTVPYDEDHNAAFYRLPAGIRRAQKEIEKEEEGEAQFSCDHICKSEVAAFYIHFFACCHKYTRLCCNRSSKRPL